MALGQLVAEGNAGRGRALLTAAAGIWIAGPRFLGVVAGAICLAMAAFWIESPRRLASGAVGLGIAAALYWAGPPLDWQAAAPGSALAAFVAAALALNTRFFRFLAERRGSFFALAAAPFFLLYLTYSSVTFAVVMARAKLTLR